MATNAEETRVPQAVGPLADVMQDFREGKVDAAECAEKLLTLSGILPDGEQDSSGDNHEVRERKAKTIRARGKRGNGKVIHLLMEHCPKLRDFLDWMAQQGVKSDAAHQYVIRLGRMVEEGEDLESAESLYSKIKADKSYPNYSQATTALNKWRKFLAQNLQEIPQSSS